MTTYRGRRAAEIENEHVRVTVLEEGGHIAEILDKRTGVNPLWTPPWPTIEPSTFDAAPAGTWGADAEAKLLAGIMGHNLCLDLFGGPSEGEAAAGWTVHGEGSVLPYAIEVVADGLTARVTLPLAQLKFERRIVLKRDGAGLAIQETVENLTACDRPLAWTEHVTLGPPFLEHGVTEIAHNGTRSKVFDSGFEDTDLQPGAEFEWPHAPKRDGEAENLGIFTKRTASSRFTTHRMDPVSNEGFAIAYNSRFGFEFSCHWKRTDFPWLGIWEENRFRQAAPWKGQAVALGLEFGTSPFPESRRAMVERGRLFETPGYRWLGAREKAKVEYRMEIQYR